MQHSRMNIWSKSAPNFLRNEPARVVKTMGKKFYEGMLEFM